MSTQVERVFCIYCKSELTIDIEKSNYFHTICREDILIYNKPPKDPYLNINIVRNTVQIFNEDVLLFKGIVPDGSLDEEFTFNFQHGFVLLYNQSIRVDTEEEYSMTIITRKELDKEWKFHGLIISHHGDYESVTFSNEYIHIFKKAILIVAIKIKRN